LDSPWPRLESKTPQESYGQNIVTADLEAIIDPNGNNKVYMAAWYNGSHYNIFDIKDYGYNTNTMLEIYPCKAYLCRHRVLARLNFPKPPIKREETVTFIIGEDMTQSYLYHPY
jgi:hypothetical protein